MSVLASLIAAGLATLAAGFAVWPVWTRAGKGRLVLAAALALLVSGIGLGSYLMVGQPFLAARDLRGADVHDLGGLVRLLVHRVHEAPGDTRAWVFLGRAYLTAGDDAQAAKALARAIGLEESAGHPAAELYSAYGEALFGASGDTVTPEAEAAFGKALARDPKNQAGRYYLGLAAASRGDTTKARALWQSLLNDAPADAPYRQDVLARITALNGEATAPPDVAAMVSRLAARLKAQPDDLEGWQRLIRSYVVLGEKAKAQAALAEARKAMNANRRALAALGAQAKASQLEE